MPARWPNPVIAARPLSRSTTIAASVVLLHIAALWALNAGLLRRAVEVIVPVAMLSDVVTPPTPKAQPPVPQPVPVERPTVRKTPLAPAPAPQPVAIADSTPSPTAPVGVVAPQAAAEPVAPAAAPQAPAPPAKVEPPSSDADYLQNPKPAYPPISRRLGEQGKVLVRVLIGADGTAQKVELRQTSGFDRLDQAALATAMRWRYVPGKRGGVPETMWFTVPMIFVLEQ